MARRYVRTEAQLFRWDELFADHRALIANGVQILEELLQAGDEARGHRGDPFHDEPRADSLEIDHSRFNGTIFIEGERGHGKTSLLLLLLELLRRLGAGQPLRAQVRGAPLVPDDDDSADARRLKAAAMPLVRRVTAVRMVDTETLEPDSVPLAALGQSLGVLVHQARDKDPARHAELEARWRTFLHAVAVGVVPAGAARRAKLDPDQLAWELSEHEENRRGLHQAWSRLIDGLAWDAVEKRERLIAVAIDDADLVPGHAGHIAGLPRLLAHPRVAFLVAGSTGQFEAALTRVHERTMPEELAKRLAREQLRKTFPVPQRMQVAPIGGEQAVGKLHSRLEAIETEGASAPSGVLSGTRRAEVVRSTRLSHFADVPAFQPAFSMPARQLVDLGKRDVSLEQLLLELAGTHDLTAEVSGFASDRQLIVDQAHLIERFPAVGSSRIAKLEAFALGPPRLAKRLKNGESVFGEGPSALLTLLRALAELPAARVAFASSPSRTKMGLVVSNHLGGRFVWPTPALPTLGNEVMRTVFTAGLKEVLAAPGHLEQQRRLVSLFFAAAEAGFNAGPIPDTRTWAPKRTGWPLSLSWLQSAVGPRWSAEQIAMIAFVELGLEAEVANEVWDALPLSLRFLSKATRMAAWEEAQADHDAKGWTEQLQEASARFRAIEGRPNALASIRIDPPDGLGPATLADYFPQTPATLAAIDEITAAPKVAEALRAASAFGTGGAPRALEAMLHEAKVPFQRRGSNFTLPQRSQRSEFIEEPTEGTEIRLPSLTLHVADQLTPALGESPAAAVVEEAAQNYVADHQDGNGEAVRPSWSLWTDVLRVTNTPDTDRCRLPAPAIDWPAPYDAHLFRSSWSLFVRHLKEVLDPEDFESLPDACVRAWLAAHLHVFFVRGVPERLDRHWSFNQASLPIRISRPIQTHDWLQLGRGIARLSEPDPDRPETPRVLRARNWARYAPLLLTPEFGVTLDAARQFSNGFFGGQLDRMPIEMAKRDRRLLSISLAREDWLRQFMAQDIAQKIGEITDKKWPIFQGTGQLINTEGTNNR